MDVDESSAGGVAPSGNQEDESIPMCTVCNHRHVQGVRCTVCGHVGRSQIYQKMRARANTKRAVRTLFYDGAAFAQCSDDWDVIMELRRRVYCVECSIPFEQEFDELLEKTSRHAVCYGALYHVCPYSRAARGSPSSRVRFPLVFLLSVGDAPTAFARYRLFKAADGAVGAEVDRLAVLQVYRRSGFTRQILQDVLADAQKYTNNTLSVLRLATVADSWMQVSLLY